MSGDGGDVIVGVRPRMERLASLTRVFRAQYGRLPAGFASAPGRVNLIGEHVDYNDGLVLPFAIDRTVLCAWAPGEGDDVRCYSADADEGTSVGSSSALPGGWAVYPAATLRAMEAATGARFSGLDLAIAGDVPQRAGLSSSAAVEVAVAGALRSALGLAIDDRGLALICQHAEREIVGVQCGVMDQMASALGGRGHALLIDCRTLEYEHIPLGLEGRGLAVVVADSGASRALVSSAYNERLRECGEAVSALRALLGRPELASLRDVTVADLERAAPGMSALPLRRARHVVGEIARVRDAVAALRAGDIAALGELMGESHRSLRDDYDVSSRELDQLVERATTQPYVAGARLTGAGFGGCTVNIVEADAVERFAADVIAPYRAATGLPAAVYVAVAADGLRAWA